MPLLIFIASFHNPAAVWRIGRLDYVCGALSVAGTVGWLVTRSGVVAIVAAIVADLLAGIPTLVKSWTDPETESVSAYLGAFLNAAILLLTVTDWTTAVVAFPLYIVCLGRVRDLPGRGQARTAPPARRGPAQAGAPGRAVDHDLRGSGRTDSGPARKSPERTSPERTSPEHRHRPKGAARAHRTRQWDRRSSSRPAEIRPIPHS